MHRAGKILMVIGVIVCAGGGLIIWGSYEIAEFDIENDHEFKGTSGSFEIKQDEGSNFYSVYVKGNVECEGFNVQIINTSSGENVFSNYCDNDDETDDWEDGFTHVGSLRDPGFGIGISPGTYSVSNADAEIYIMDTGEELAEGILGLLGYGVAFVVLCCGAFFLVLGLVLGLTIKTQQPVIVVAPNQPAGPLG